MGAVVHYSHKEQAGPLKFTSGFEVFLPRTRSHTLRGRVRGTSRANRADALWMSNHQVYSNLCGLLLYVDAAAGVFTELGRSSEEQILNLR